MKAWWWLLATLQFVLSEDLSQFNEEYGPVEEDKKSFRNVFNPQLFAMEKKRLRKDIDNKMPKFHPWGSKRYNDDETLLDDNRNSPFERVYYNPSSYSAQENDYSLDMKYLMRQKDPTYLEGHNLANYERTEDIDLNKVDEKEACSEFLDLSSKTNCKQKNKTSLPAFFKGKQNLNPRSRDKILPKFKSENVVFYLEKAKRNRNLLSKFSGNDDKDSMKTISRLEDKNLSLQGKRVPSYSSRGGKRSSNSVDQFDLSLSDISHRLKNGNEVKKETEINTFNDQNNETDQNSELELYKIFIPDYGSHNENSERKYLSNQDEKRAILSELGEKEPANPNCEDKIPAFWSWGGKRDKPAFSSWEGKRDKPAFWSWGGKRDRPAFWSWGGKRDRPAFWSWGGKRDRPAFWSWGGKRDRPAFWSWGGKRDRPAFWSWGGKRDSPAFWSWGGKRDRPAFWSWGGKRDRPAFWSWGGKRDRPAFWSWGGKREDGVHEVVITPNRNIAKYEPLIQRNPFLGQSGERAAFLPTEVKRGAAFSSWGGKRDDEMYEADVEPNIHIPKYELYAEEDPSTRQSDKRASFSSWGGKRKLGICLETFGCTMDKENGSSNNFYQSLENKRENEETKNSPHQTKSKNVHSLMNQYLNELYSKGWTDQNEENKMSDNINLYSYEPQYNPQTLENVEQSEKISSANTRRWDEKRGLAFSSWGGKRSGTFTIAKGKDTEIPQNANFEQAIKNGKVLNAESETLKFPDEINPIQRSFNMISKKHQGSNSWEDKRALAFNSWGGKRATAFNSWGGKRGLAFSSWGGKRAPAFNSWGGKRALAFNSWGGKREPAFNDLVGKRAVAFSSWGGKRAPAFNDLEGKRAAAFSSWGGKRAVAFSSWGGKRTPAFNRWEGIIPEIPSSDTEEQLRNLTYEDEDSDYIGNESVFSDDQPEGLENVDTHSLQPIQLYNNFDTKIPKIFLDNNTKEEFTIDYGNNLTDDIYSNVDHEKLNDNDKNLIQFNINSQDIKPISESINKGGNKSWGGKRSNILNWNNNRPETLGTNSYYNENEFYDTENGELGNKIMENQGKDFSPNLFYPISNLINYLDKENVRELSHRGVNRPDSLSLEHRPQTERENDTEKIQTLKSHDLSQYKRVPAFYSWGGKRGKVNFNQGHTSDTVNNKQLAAILDPYFNEINNHHKIIQKRAKRSISEEINYSSLLCKEDEKTKCSHTNPAGKTYLMKKNFNKLATEDEFENFNKRNPNLFTNTLAKHNGVLESERNYNNQNKQNQLNYNDYYPQNDVLQTILLLPNTKMIRGDLNEKELERNEYNKSFEKKKLNQNFENRDLLLQRYTLPLDINSYNQLQLEEESLLPEYENRKPVDEYIIQNDGIRVLQKRKGGKKRPIFWSWAGKRSSDKKVINLPTKNYNEQRIFKREITHTQNTNKRAMPELKMFNYFISPETTTKSQSQIKQKRNDNVYKMLNGMERSQLDSRNNGVYQMMLFNGNGLREVRLPMTKPIRRGAGFYSWGGKRSSL